MFVVFPKLGPQIRWSRDEPWAGALRSMGDHSESLEEDKNIHNEKASMFRDIRKYEYKKKTRDRSGGTTCERHMCTTRRHPKDGTIPTTFLPPPQNTPRLTLTSLLALLF